MTRKSEFLDALQRRHDAQIRGPLRVDKLTPEQLSDIEAHIRGLTDEAETYDAPPHGWTCFHCGEIFKTEQGARLHFGEKVTGRPVCCSGDVHVDLLGTLKLAEDAIAEFYRYQTGGDGKHGGSYDGKPEREGLWRALASIRTSIAKARGL